MSMMLIVVLLWSCSVDENSDSNKSSSLYRVSLNISSCMNNLTRSVNSSGTDDGTSTEWIKSCCSILSLLVAARCGWRLVVAMG